MTRLQQDGKHVLSQTPVSQESRGIIYDLEKQEVQLEMFDKVFVMFP